MAKYDDFTNEQWSLPQAFNNNQDFTNDQQFQMPTMAGNYGSNFTLVDQPQGDMTAFSPERAPNTSYAGMEQPGFLDRLGTSLGNLNFDPSNQTGMTNLFRAGEVGVGGLGAMLQMRENKKARQQQQSAIDYIKSQANPNAQLFQQRLVDMIDKPQGYLNDPVDAAMAQQAEEGALRTANRQGRSTLSRDDMLSVQKLRQGSYQNRLKTLMDLYQQAQQGNQAAAEAIGRISSQRAGGSDVSAIQGALEGMFKGGRQIAETSGLTTTQQQPANRQYMVNMNPEQASRFAEYLKAGA